MSDICARVPQLYSGLQWYPSPNYNLIFSLPFFISQIPPISINPPVIKHFQKSP